jgi:hypothetical protein
MTRIGLAFVVAAAAVAVPAIADAKDSTWLVCKGVGSQGAKADTKTYVVASLLEHRGADGRNLAVTLIYGDNVSRAEAIGKKGDDFVGKPAKLKLLSIGSGHRTTLDGTITLAADMASVAIDGALDPTFGSDAKSKPVPFTAKLSCETLDDQSIGH